MMRLSGSWFNAAAGVVLALALAAPAQGADVKPMQGPLDVAARRALVAKSAGLYACAAIPETVREAGGVDFFTDASQSIVDVDAQSRHRAAVKPVEDYARGVQAIALSYLKFAPADLSIADCALDWLSAWAKEEGLLDDPATLAADRQQEAVIAGIAQAALIVMTDPRLSSAKLQPVQEWFQKLGTVVKDRWSQPDALKIGEEARAWAFTATLLAGIVAQDRGLTTWATVGLKQFLTRIDAQGFIRGLEPRERRLRHTHMIALSALVLAAETLSRNGQDLYAAEGGAVRRLADLVIRGYQDPSTFVQKARGIAQSWPPKFQPYMAAWMEPYYARFRDARLVPFLVTNRHVSWIQMGGDLTTLYGVKPLPQ
ncbi:MAG: alginate lyase family protein [Elstera sp.]